jgi:hypothetical protein
MRIKEVMNNTLLLIEEIDLLKDASLVLRGRTINELHIDGLLLVRFVKSPLFSSIIPYASTIGIFKAKILPVVWDEINSFISTSKKIM